MQTISLWIPLFHFCVSLTPISLCPQYDRLVRRVWFELLFLAYAHPSLDVYPLPTPLLYLTPSHLTRSSSHFYLLLLSDPCPPLLSALSPPPFLIIVSK